MTAPRVSQRNAVRASLLAREIGATVRRERLAKGDDLKDLARNLGTGESSIGNISDFERNPRANMMLGKAVAMLNLYGYTLEIVRIADARKRPAPKCFTVGFPFYGEEHRAFITLEGGAPAIRVDSIERANDDSSWRAIVKPTPSLIDEAKGAAISWISHAERGQ
jgi:transcriptional regulator with XRE-family HTH domain